MKDIIIRPERAADIAPIRAVHVAAFGHDAEARLVDALREASAIVTSLVADVNADLAGSAVFSLLPLETANRTLPAVALAPVAVLPQLQRLGIGSALIRAGIAYCKKRGNVAMLVLGDPAYYSRFGFSARLARNIASPYSAAGDAWMALELAPSSLKNVTANARYPDAFRLVS